MSPGVNGLGLPGGARGSLDAVANDADALVRFCVDRRGVWLTVGEDAQGVHVNGREVRRMAMLRVGDAVYVQGVEMRLVSERVPQPPPEGIGPATDDDGDPRVVIRGVGGQYHGRSFTLERPRLVGRAADADIRIDDLAFADRHARLERFGDYVLLRDIGSVDGSEVNGVPVRDALLQPGDQVVFDSHHRFVVEAPARTLQERDWVDDEGAGAAVEGQPLEAEPVDAAAGSLKLPWLLGTALLLAGLLGALLLFGAA